MNQSQPRPGSSPLESGLFIGRVQAAVSAQKKTPHGTGLVGRMPGGLSDVQTGLSGMLSAV